MTREQLVVVGNGMAGARTVEEILARGGAERFDITMIGDEPYGNYNRILLSNVMNGSQDPTEIFLNSLPWYEDNGIRLLAGTRADRIDRFAKKVLCTSGQEVPFDKLILATGSRALIPPIKDVLDASGALRKNVFGFRTLDDCREIVNTAKTVQRAAVIGGGLLGLEAAKGLLSHGCEVHVVHLAPYLMNAQLDKPSALMVRAAMQAMGIQVHLDKATTAIKLDASGRVTGLEFKDG
jgi:nitrite reductase (NADH) large subunit